MGPSALGPGEFILKDYTPDYPCPIYLQIILLTGLEAPKQ